MTGDPQSSHVARRRGPLRLAAGVLLAFVLSGCATYHPEALDDEAVREGLRPPDEDAVRVAAETLRHPILKPLAFVLHDGLSPDEAAILAVVANPDLRAARARRGVAAASLLAAGILPDPQLTAAVDIPVDDTTAAVTGISLGLALDLNTLFTRGAEVRSARAARASVDLDIAWQEWQAAQQARLQVYRTASLERQVTLAQEEEANLAQNLDVVQEAARRRLVTEVERAAAEDALQTARAIRLELEQARDGARLMLNQALGLPPETHLTLQAGGTLPYIPPPDSLLQVRADTTAMQTLPSLQDLLDSLEVRRLDLAALRIGYESQEEALRAAVLRQFPRINIGVNRIRDTGNLLTLGPGVSIDLPFFSRNRGEIALARATRAQLRAEYFARLFEARAEVAALLPDIARTRERLRNAEAAFPTLRRLVAIYGEALRRGNADVLSYYSARTSLINRELDVLKLRQTLAELVVALELVSGRYFAPTATGPSDK